MRHEPSPRVFVCPGFHFQMVDNC